MVRPIDCLDNESDPVYTNRACSSSSNKVLDESRSKHAADYRDVVVPSKQNRTSPAQSKKHRQVPVIPCLTCPVQQTP